MLTITRLFMQGISSTSAYRGVVLCGFPDTPGHLEEHLVVIDVKDRAMFIGDPRQDEWQVFPDRVFLPLADLKLTGNTVRCTGNQQAGPSVDVHFNFKPDAEAFMAAVKLTYSDEDRARELQDSNPLGAGFDTAGWNVLKSGAAFMGMGIAAKQGAGHPPNIKSAASPQPMPAALATKPPGEPSVAAELGYAEPDPDFAEIAKAKGVQLEKSIFDKAGRVDNNPGTEALILALDKKLSAEPDKMQYAAYHLATETVGEASKADAGVIKVGFSEHILGRFVLVDPWQAALNGCKVDALCIPCCML